MLSYVLCIDTRIKKLKLQLFFPLYELDEYLFKATTYVVIMQNKCITSTEIVGKDNRNADICGNLMLSMWKQYEKGNLKLFSYASNLSHVFKHFSYNL